MYRREFGQLFVLALPLCIAQLAQNTISFVDTLMVGRLGNDALAGIAIGATFFHFVQIFLSGVIFGVGPIVSQAIGAEDHEKARRAARQGLILGAAITIPAFAMCWNAYPILLLLGQTEATAAASSGYLRAISWGLLPALWIMALRGYLEGNSNTRPIMVVAFLGIIANVCFNYVLMYGKFGFPALGLVGTGYASSLVYWCGFLLLLGYVKRKYKSSNVFQGVLTPDFSMLREVVRVGAPISMTLGFELIMFSAATIAMGTLGTNELAAHKVALQTASIAFMIPLGLAIATAVRVGQAIGRKSRKEAEVAGHCGMIACIACMCLSGLVFWLFPRSIISLYVDLSDPENAQLIEFAVGFLAIAALFQIFDGLQVSASGALRGMKDTKAAMVLTLISYLLIGVTSGAALCFSAGLRGTGLWLGMTLGLAAAAILLTIRFQWKVRKLEIE